MLQRLCYNFIIQVLQNKFCRIIFIKEQNQSPFFGLLGQKEEKLVNLQERS